MEPIFSLIDYGQPPDTQLLDSYSRTITGVVGQVAEAVVHIQVQKPAEIGRAPRTEGRGRSDGGSTRLMPASGSGFIISTDGFVVTNNHVIEKAQDIRVSQTDGRCPQN